MNEGMRHGSGLGITNEEDWGLMGITNEEEWVI